VTRTTALPLRRGSLVWRTVVLVAAWLWAGAVVAFYHGYHIAQPPVAWAEYGGHTFTTHPPALTLAQRDHVSAEIVTVALCLAVGIGTVDLVVRIVWRMRAPGVAAISAGGMLMLFSLFGLLRGLAGIGTAGLLVILSGLPMRSTAPSDPESDRPSASGANWYADPTGRNDFRYWDGSAWSPHVATGGRSSADPL